MLDTEDLIKESTKLEKYLIKHGHDDLVREIQGMNEDQLNEKLRKQMSHRQELLDTKSKDEELKAAKKRANYLNSTYTEQTRMCDKIARFIHLQIKDKQ
jgi:hypothetical protein